MIEPDCEQAAYIFVRFFGDLTLMGEFLSLLDDITPREDLNSLKSCETTCAAYRQYTEDIRYYQLLLIKIGHNKS